MSLALISELYNNADSDSELGGEEWEAVEDIKKNENGMSKVGNVYSTGRGSEYTAKVTAFDCAGVENEGELAEVSSCPQSQPKRKRKKRVGNWMWSYKRRRLGRVKSKSKHKTLPNHDQLCEAKNVQQFGQLVDSIPGGDSKEINLGTVDSKRTDFKCPHCADIFRENDELIMHLATHYPNGAISSTDNVASITKGKIVKDHANKLPAQQPGNMAKLKRYDCSKCGATFSQAKSLRKHIMTLHSKVGRPFKCSQCGCSFAATDHLQRHEKLRHGIVHPSHKKCLICNQSFRHTGERKTHLSATLEEAQMELHKETDNRPFKCQQCPSFFNKCAQLTIHENRVHGRKQGRTRYPCGVCGKVMSRLRLIRHISSHTDTNRPLKCSHCESYFSNLVALRIHENQDHQRMKGRSKFACGVCKKVVRRRSEWTRHMKHAHGKEVDLASALKFVCKTAAAPSAKSGADDKHVPGKLAVENIRGSGKIKLESLNSHECNFCGKSFPFLSWLKRHAKFHFTTGRLPFRCLKCSRSFRTKPHLRNHNALAHKSDAKSTGAVDDKPISHPQPNPTKECSRKEEEMENVIPSAHKNRKPTCHNCPNCSMILSSRGSLNRHMRIHKQGFNRNWKCSPCNSFFGSASHLRRHENRAHGRKASRCPCKVCGRLIYSAEKLAAHMLTHGDIKLFSCATCGLKFRTKNSAEQHLRTKHTSLRSTANVKMMEESSVHKENFSPRLNMLNQVCNIQLRPCALVLTRCDDLLPKSRGLNISSKEVKKAGPRRKLVRSNSALMKTQKLDWKSARANETEHISKSVRNENACLNEELGKISATVNMSSGYPTRSKIGTGNNSKKLAMPINKRMRTVTKKSDIVQEAESQICADSGDGNSISFETCESEIEVEHVELLLPPRVFNCPYCPESFEEGGLLIGHLPIHTEETMKTDCKAASSEDVANSKPEENEDGAIVSGNDTRTVFEELPESGPQPIKIEESEELICPECDSSFPTDRGLRLHMREHAEPRRMVKCFQCSLSFATFKSLQIHDNRFHKVANPSPSIPTTIQVDGCQGSNSPADAVAKFDEQVCEVTSKSIHITHSQVSSNNSVLSTGAQRTGKLYKGHKSVMNLTFQYR